MLAVLATIVVFAQVSISIWAFPTVGAYILSLSFIGSFWVTGYDAAQRRLMRIETSLLVRSVKACADDLLTDGNPR